GCEQQQHDRAVHGEVLVELLGAGDHLDAGGEQFGPDHQGQQPPDAEEQERGHHVQVADDLVIGGGDPLQHRGAQALPLRAQARDRLGHLTGGGVLFVDGHQSSSPWPGRFWPEGIETRSRLESNWPVCPCSRSASMCSAYSASERTSTLKSMFAWNSPHNSAHLPMKVPSTPGVTWKTLRSPGIMSSLYRNAGTQKECATSRESTTNSTVLSTGSTRVGTSS